MGRTRFQIKIVANRTDSRHSCSSAKPTGSVTRLRLSTTTSSVARGVDVRSLRPCRASEPRSPLPKPSRTLARKIKAILSTKPKLPTRKPKSKSVCEPRGSVKLKVLHADKNGEVEVEEIKVTPTAVLDTLVEFMNVRHEIFQKRLRGDKASWTTDKVLMDRKFCNVFREYDRETQYLISKILNPLVQAAPSTDPEERRKQNIEFVWRIWVFRCFNKQSTWEALKQKMGDKFSAEKFKKEEFADALFAIRAKFSASGEALYSSAYQNHANHSLLQGSHAEARHMHQVEYMLSKGIPDRLLGAMNLKEFVEIIREVPSAGPFISYQLALDMRYTPYLNVPADNFAACGPGSKAALNRIFNTKIFTTPKLQLAGLQFLSARYPLYCQRLGYLPPVLERLAVDGTTTIAVLSDGTDGEPVGVFEAGIVEIEHALCEVEKYCKGNDNTRGFQPADPRER